MDSRSTNKLGNDFNQTEIWEADRAHFIHPYTDFASFHSEGSQIISSASGMHVIDADGRQYLDGMAGLWCVNIGHGRSHCRAGGGNAVL